MADPLVGVGMFPHALFNCPRCGAPGQVVMGQAQYTCTCRLGQYTAPECRHEWVDVKTWDDSSGQHGSKRCCLCQRYAQW